MKHLDEKGLLCVPLVTVHLGNPQAFWGGFLELLLDTCRHTDGQAEVHHGKGISH